jgi:chlorite dismutase
MEPLATDLGDDDDYLFWVTRENEDVKNASQELERVVIACRRRGISWTAIGRALGTSKQGAMQKYSRITDA